MIMTSCCLLLLCIIMYIAVVLRSAHHPTTPPSSKLRCCPAQIKTMYGKVQEFESLNIDSSSLTSPRRTSLRGRLESLGKQGLGKCCLAAFMVAMLAISLGQLISLRTAGMDGSMQSDLSNYTKSIEKLLRKIYGGHSPETKLTDF